MSAPGGLVLSPWCGQLTVGGQFTSAAVTRLEFHRPSELSGLQPLESHRPSELSGLQPLEGREVWYIVVVNLAPRG